MTRLTQNLTTLLAAVLALSAATLRADTVRLREQATVSTASVTLADVAELQGDSAKALADVSLGQMDENQSLAINLAQVREVLSGRNVNWGRLTLSGYTRCTVRREATAAKAAVVTAEPTPVVANPTQEVNLQQAQTVRQQLVQHLASLQNVDPATLVVEFDPSDDALLGQVTLGEKLDIQPAGDLGRVMIALRRWRGSDLVATYRINANVSRKVTAVVMRQAISRGQTFTDQHVALAEVMLHDGRELPLQSLESVIGLVADSTLRQGAVVYPRTVKTPMMVQRNELVTVRVLSGGLAITTTARAMQDGCLGDTVQVRNERSREVYSVKITGQRQATLVVETDAREGGAS